MRSLFYLFLCVKFFNLEPHYHKLPQPYLFPMGHYPAVVRQEEKTL